MTEIISIDTGSADETVICVREGNEIKSLSAQPKYKRVDLETLKRVHPIRDRANGVYSSASYEVDGYNRAIDEIKSKYGDLYTIERE